MATCKTIIVAIQDYDPAITYTVYARPINSAFDFATVNTLTKIATSATTTFDNVSGDYEYEVGVQKTCNGSVSKIEWKNPANLDCNKVLNVTFDNGASEFTITLPSTTASVEWRIDNKPWVYLASNATDTLTLAFGDIATEAGYENNYGTDANVVYQIEVRVYCSATSKSQSFYLTYISNPTDEASIKLLENICQDGLYYGQRLRLSMPVKAAATGTENITYDSPSAAAEVIASWTRTIGVSPELEIELAKLAVNGYNKLVVIDPASDNRSASIDFVSDIPPQGIERIAAIPCGDYPSYYSIT